MSIDRGRIPFAETQFEYIRVIRRIVDIKERQVDLVYANYNRNFLEFNHQKNIYSNLDFEKMSEAQKKVTSHYQCNDDEVNNEDVFEWEMKLCEDFQYYEETEDIKIAYNVSANLMTIWVHYHNNWNGTRGFKILNRLVNVVS